MENLEKKSETDKEALAEAAKELWDAVPDKFVVFDLETTGLEHRKNTVLEIGAAKFEKKDYLLSGELSTFQILIKQDKAIPEEATKIHGITDEMVAEGESAHSALDKFFDFVGDTQLYSYNSKFDVDFLNSFSKRALYSKQELIDVEDVIDILAFTREHRDVKPNYKLTTVAKSLGIEIDGAHRALKDSVMALRIFIKLTQEYHVLKRYQEIKNTKETRKRVMEEHPEWGADEVRLKLLDDELIAAIRTGMFTRYEGIQKEIKETKEKIIQERTKRKMEVENRTRLVEELKSKRNYFYFVSIMAVLVICFLCMVFFLDTDVRSQFE